MRLSLSFTVFFLALFTGFSQGNVIYVDHEASGQNNGSSWANAYVNLQNAINNSTPGQEIWVAEGIYFPSEDKDGNTNPTDSRDKAFHLKAGVSVYGGFTGNETNKPTDPWMNPSILSGDIGTYGNVLDNAYRVMYNFSIDSGYTSITGFIIEGGNCINAPRSGGAGILEARSSIVYSHLWIRNNRAERGGGVATGDCISTFQHCKFTNNYAQEYGGAFNNWTSKSIIVDSEFSNNTADGQGGALFGVDPHYKLRSCIFRQNSAGLRGGAIGIGSINLNHSRHPITMHDVLFEYNSASDKGAAIYAQARPAYLSDVVCRYNNGSPALYLTGHFHLSNVLVHNNPRGGLIANQNSFGTEVKIYNSTLVQAKGSGKNAFSATSTFGTCHTEIYNSIIDGSIAKDTPAVVSYHHSLIPGSRPNGVWDSSLGIDSSGNLDGIPLYFSETNHNYRLWKCSPGIDAGDSTRLAGDWPDLNGDNDTTETLLADISSHQRIWGQQVDVGAYEYSPRAILRQDTNTLHSEIDSADSYTWLNCLTGNIVSTDTVFTFPTDSAEHFALIVTRNGCTDTSTCGAFNANITRKEVQKTPAVEFYPNPAQNWVSLQGVGKKYTRLVIFNLAGEVIMQQTLQAKEQQEISVQHLPPGIYLISLQGDASQTTFKLAIQR